VVDVPPMMTWLGNTFALGGTQVGYGAVLMLLLYAGMWFWLRETAAGRHVYAVGNNPEATRLTGIPTERVLLGVYVLAGVFYGIASLLSVARTGVGDPNAGQTENLDAITAVVLGGTSLFGGRGVILGSLVGAIVVGVLRNGLTLMGVASVYQELVAQVDPLVVVEKSPAYTVDIKRLRAIRKAFPDARFLHLTRHPVGQCKSVMSLYDGTFALFVNSIEFGADRAFVEPQYAWHDFNVNILNFLDSVPAELQMRVRGEDLMSDPPRYLVDICRWLGLRTDVDALEEMMHPERSPFACFGPLDALFGNDPNFLSGPTFRPHKVKMPSLGDPVPWREDDQGLKPEIVALARELGY
jgi:hypothetical protein